MNSDRPITSREFTREMENVKDSLGRIEDHLERLNGKTATNTENIAVLKRDVQALIDEDVEIDKKVEQLAIEGCAHYRAHTAMLQELAGVSAWSPKKKAAVSAGLVGSGALMWPALQEIAKAFHALLEKL